MGFLWVLWFPPSPNNMYYSLILQQVIVTTGHALEMDPKTLCDGCSLLLMECPGGIEGWVKCTG